VDDGTVIGRIDELVAEEHELFELAASGEALTPEQLARQKDIEVHLDRLWDLLRQRRARRNAGLDPDDAITRDAETVEHYQQ